MFPYMHMFVLLVFCSDIAHVLHSAEGGRTTFLGGESPVKDLRGKSPERQKS